MTHCPLLFDSALTLLMFLMGTALGARLLARIRLPSIDRLEYGLFAATVGMGLLAYLPFALFAVGLGRPPVIVGAVLLVALALLPDGLAIARGAGRFLRQSVWRVDPPLPPALRIIVIACLPILAITFLRALCPPTDADGLYYHLTAPLSYLKVGRFHYMPTFLMVNWPLGIEMLFGIGLAFHTHYAAGMVQFGLGLLLLLATYSLGRRLASSVVGWLAAATILPWIRGEMTWAYIDLGLTLTILMATYAFLIGWQALTTYRQNGFHSSSFLDSGEGAFPPRECTTGQGAAFAERAAAASHIQSAWTLSALLTGLAVTTKLFGALLIGILGALVAWAVYDSNREQAKGERVQQAVLAALRFAGLALLVVAPWFLKTFVLTGDPVYPYLAGRLGARDWSPAFAQRLNEYFQMFNTLRSRTPDPGTVIKLRTAGCTFFLLAGILLCRWRGTRPVRPLIVVACALGFLVVASIGINLRYLLPIYPLVAVLLFWGLRDRLMRPAALYGIVFVVCLAQWGFARMPSILNGQIQSAREALPVALGITSRDVYLSRHLPIYPMLGWCNAHLPPDATVALTTLDAYAALLQRRSLQTNLWTQEAIRYDDFDQMRGDLQRLGATHVLLRSAEATTEEIRNRSKEDRTRLERELPLLERCCREYGAPIHEDNGYTLYVLRDRERRGLAGAPVGRKEPLRNGGACFLCGSQGMSTPHRKGDRCDHSNR